MAVSYVTDSTFLMGSVTQESRIQRYQLGLAFRGLDPGLHISSPCVASDRFAPPFCHGWQVSEGYDHAETVDGLTFPDCCRLLSHIFLSKGSNETCPQKRSYYSLCHCHICVQIRCCLISCGSWINDGGNISGSNGSDKANFNTV